MPSDIRYIRTGNGWVLGHVRVPKLVSLTEVVENHQVFWVINTLLQKDTASLLTYPGLLY